MGQQNTGNILVVWRGKHFNLEVDTNSNVKELGHKLQELTNVNSDTLRLFVPQHNNKGSRMLSPFSESHSSLSLQEASFLEGKPIRMMGVSSEEIDQVSQSQMKSDTRILGFDEEEKRLRQRATYRPQAPLKLPQGPHIFCEFRTLHIPGVELNPPPSEALRRMHMLACDPGIIAIMNKHRWRVGIMTEMAPEGYVGISPKCLLGFNKNHGEEISLRLRTDDLKGFRKYDSIMKTLLHELAHMVYSEHDSDFFALNKQLNDEAASLDWTKSKSQTLSGHKFSEHFEEDDFLELSSRTSGQKLGGKLDPSTSARASSIAAAYNRLMTASSDAVAKAGSEPAILEEPDPDSSELTDNKVNVGAEPDPDDSLRKENGALPTEMIIDSVTERLVTESLIADRYDEPDPDEFLETSMVSEPYAGSFQGKRSILLSSQPDPDDSLDIPNSVSTRPFNLDANSKSISELDPDESGYNRLLKDVEMEDFHPGKNFNTLNADNSAKNVVSDSLTNLQQSAETRPLASNFGAGDDNLELQIIEEPAAVICSRLQKAIDKLKSEANPSEATIVLQTLFKIIRNVIENPHEVKFRRLRKANPQFQRNVANHKAAMEVLNVVGFTEDVISDELGRSETFVVLKRNDPGLLWLAKSSLEMSVA